MRILIFIKGVYDTKVPVEYKESTGSLKADRNVTMLNPSDRRAIDCALEIRESSPDNHVVLVHLGPSSTERFLREGLALGCDEALRVWDDGLSELQTQAKAVVLSRVARIYAPSTLFWPEARVRTRLPANLARSSHPCFACPASRPQHPCERRNRTRSSLQSSSLTAPSSTSSRSRPWSSP